MRKVNRTRPRRRINLARTLFILPNLITLASVFCGFYSVILSTAVDEPNHHFRAAMLIIFGMFFDMLDGRVARMTKTQSAFGLQIDSLADVITFGLAPAVLVHQWSLSTLGPLGLLVSFSFPACGAIRLARFNVLSMGENGAPTKPSKYVIGLPIPGAAGILVSVVLTNHAISGKMAEPAYIGVVTTLTLGLSALMVSTVRFRTFKDLQLNARGLSLVLFAIVSSVFISIQARPVFVLLWLLSLYVLLALVESALRVAMRLAGKPMRDSTAPPPAVSAPTAPTSPPSVPPKEGP